MRPIDAEPIEKFIENGLNGKDKLKQFGHDAIEILTKIHYAPTISIDPPPNAPLTLDQLREMDGECVIVETDGEILTSHDSGVFVFAQRRKVLSAKYYGKTWLAYRRKPEEGMR